MNKDYSNDVKSMNNTDKIISKINMLKQPISEMSETDQAKTLKYIQNLSNLYLIKIVGLQIVKRKRFFVRDFAMIVL